MIAAAIAIQVVGIVVLVACAAIGAACQIYASEHPEGRS